MSQQVTSLKNISKNVIVALVSTSENSYTTFSNDSVILFVLRIVVFSRFLLTLGAHAQRGLRYLVCLSVGLSVYNYSCTTGNEANSERYQRLQCNKGALLTALTDTLDHEIQAN